jgi:hypothetical protein
MAMSNRYDGPFSPERTSVNFQLRKAVERKGHSLESLRDESHLTFTASDQKAEEVVPSASTEHSPE